MNRQYSSLCLMWLAAGLAGYGVRVGVTGVNDPPSPSANLSPAKPSAAVRDGAGTGKSAAGNGQSFNVLAMAGAGDMPGIFAEYDAISDPWRREEALRLLTARWVELDPQAALEFFKARTFRAGVESVLVQWALLDPAAVAAVMQESKGALPGLDSILRTLPPADGKAAVRLLLAFPEGKPVPELMSSDTWRDVVARLAHADFEGMLKAVDRFAEPGAYRSQVLAAIAAGRALNDPDGALEWARGLEKGRTEVVGEILKTISLQDPARAAREFLRTPKLMAAAMGGSSEGFLLEGIAVQLGKTDPAAALRWIREAVGKEENFHQLAQGAAGQILQQALRDPSRIAKVFPAIQEMLDPEALMFPGWAPAGRLNAALEAVDALAAGQARDRLLANLAAQAAASDPMASLKWLDSITDPKAREAYAASIRFWPDSPQAPALSRQFYEALPPDLKAAAAPRLAEFQARDNSPAAAGWAQSLTDGTARQKALTSALSIWTSRDSISASTWVNEMPAGPARDAAVSGLVRGILHREPSSAFVWAASIVDPARQSDSFLRTLDRWRENDPAAAIAAVEATGLPASRREELIQFIQSKERWNAPAD